MSIKKLVETIKHNGILASAGELKKLFTKAVEAEEKNIELQQKITDLAVQLANAESKCRELAAENVTLNDKMNKLATWPGIEFYSSAWEFCNLDGNDALEFMCDVKTPAAEDGWLMVPIEPTQEMLNAAWVSHGIYHPSAYRTMLAAAPQRY
ncbi:hypothetical protein LB58_21255 [Salmonella enterica]|nr:hypothetical protein [Salmonella enterica]